MSHDYDDIIIESIRYKFKTVKEISEETGISKNRITIRLKHYMKWNLIISMLVSESKGIGVKPMKYMIKKQNISDSINN